MRRLTSKIRKLLRDVGIDMEFESWYRQSVDYYEQHVFRRRTNKLEMRIIFYRYLRGYGVRRIAKRCRTSERYVDELLHMMTLIDENPPAQKKEYQREDEWK